MNKKYAFFFLFGFASACKPPSSTQKQQDPAAVFHLVNDWPQLSPGYQLSQPTGIGIDNQDHVLVFHRTGRNWTTPFPDSLISQNTVLELDNETGKTLHAWGANHFIMPHGLTVDKQNNVWLTDVALHQVFKFDHQGRLLQKWGVAKVPGNDSTHFNLPTDVAVADDGSFFVSDGYGNSRVVHFSAAGHFLKAWGSFGKQPGQFIIPHGIAIDNKQLLYVADRQNNRIQVFDTKGKFLREIKNDSLVEQLPSVALDAQGRIFAIDYDPSKKSNGLAKGSTFFGLNSFFQPLNHHGVTGTTERTTCWFHDLAIDSKGNIYVGDITGLKVIKFKPNTR